MFQRKKGAQRSGLGRGVGSQGFERRRWVQFRTDEIWGACGYPGGGRPADSGLWGEVSAYRGTWELPLDASGHLKMTQFEAVLFLGHFIG